MLKSYDDKHEVRVDYLRCRASYHLKMVSEANNYFDKIHHWKTFLMLNDMYMEEKDERESKKD